MRSKSNNPDERQPSPQQKIRAVEYVRMSTEHQKYSTQNQSDAIVAYAEKRGMEIIRTYSDAGKSGLNIKGRNGLKQLIDDVQTDNPDFQVILVYDISRWGRFQDADESAYYEHICQRAGISVHFCAEQFENDGSISATIFKGVKRAMAGEYSRELSVKVFAGQCRLIELGFRQGGPAGYGLRRMLIDEHGNQKGILKRGEHKSLQTDRVILVPGPGDEIQIVNRIYRLFAEELKSETEIAGTLNAEGHQTDLERPWTRDTVHQILTNEKYIGNNIFNRTSFKLKKRRVANTPKMWIRAEGVFEKVIELPLFHAAQKIIVERSHRLSDEEMLEQLKQLYGKYGYLSGIIINEADNIPQSGAYSHRFGSLLRAYELVGFRPDRDYSYLEINRRLREYYPRIVEQVTSRIVELGASVERNQDSGILTMNSEFSISIVLARHQLTKAGSSRWNIRFDAGLRPDITLAVRMDQANEEALDYYLLPRLDFCKPTIRLATENGAFLDTYRFENLDYLFYMVERSPLKEVA